MRRGEQRDRPEGDRIPAARPAFDYFVRPDHPHPSPTSSRTVPPHRTIFYVLDGSGQPGDGMNRISLARHRIEAGMSPGAGQSDDVVDLDQEIDTPVIAFKRKRIIIQSLSSSEDEVEGQGKEGGMDAEKTVLLGSDSENTRDSDHIHHPGRRARRGLTSDDDELAFIASSEPVKVSLRQQTLHDEKERKALAILKERTFNTPLDEEQLIEVLKQTKFDVIRAERQIKQVQADRLKSGLMPTKTVPKKQYYTVRRDHVADDSDDDDVQPLVVRPVTVKNDYLSMVAKSSASGSGPAAAAASAMVSDSEDDEVKAVPAASFFSKPSTLRIGLPLAGPQNFPIFQRKKPAAKPKNPRGKRRFNVYHSDDEEEDEEDMSFINDDSEEEDDDDVVLSDDEDDDQDYGKRKKRAKSKKAKKVKRAHLEDELTNLTSEEDEFEEKEQIDSSSDEDGPSVSPKTMKRIQRSEKQDTLRVRVVQFMNEGTTFDLQTISGVSKKKADQIIDLRPFIDYSDLRGKLESTKGLKTDIINDSLEAIRSRDVITNLMAECESLSSGITEKVQNLKEAMQPMILNKECVLKQYQLIGLNWLVLMHEKKVNAILADEMGLGKTIQVIALLAYLKEKLHNRGPHLIVVPASTLDNWDRELSLWCRHLDVLVYHGSQKERHETRIRILDGDLSFEIILTTYNMVFSEDDKKLFKKYKFQYIVFDEAHLLKNMKTKRYAQLMMIKSQRRLLLTGTPLQNNLLELMSLLIFTMPDFFMGKTEQVKAMFTFNNFTCKGDADSRSSDSRQSYEQERIAHAKKIMKPFVLRRLKADVLQQLPPKIIVLKKCNMTPKQEKLYKELVSCYQKDIEHDISIMEEVEVDENSNDEVRELKMSDGHVRTVNRGGKDLKAHAGASMIMNLRKVANHPLLVRNHYTDSKLRQMSQLMLKEPTHHDANPEFIREDMELYSDFELHELCLKFKSLNRFILPQNLILESGKMQVLDQILPQLKEKKQKVLLFSQFCMTLDIIEVC